VPYQNHHRQAQGRTKYLLPWGGNNKEELKNEEAGYISHWVPIPEKAKTFCWPPH
jgi:hypothetical protein